MRVQLDLYSQNWETRDQSDIESESIEMYVHERNFMSAGRRKGNCWPSKASSNLLQPQVVSELTSNNDNRMYRFYISR
jgi:hypothetical protein